MEYFVTLCSALHQSSIREDVSVVSQVFDKLLVTSNGHQTALLSSLFHLYDNI